MMEVIISIPESIGWVMVGAIGMLCVVMMFEMGKIIIEGIRERLDYEEEFAEQANSLPGRMIRTGPWK